MTSWEFVIIIGCAVAGFLLVSFILEVIGSKKKPTNRPSGNFAGENSRSNDETVREPMWFEVLGVQPAASIDEIKAAYRERARQYHPDRVEGLGFEIRQVAEQKMKQLNAAYNSALKSR
jgi:preprotein translocase subunit Sec63